MSHLEFASRLERGSHIRVARQAAGIISLLLLVGNLAWAAQSEPERVRSFERLPDWTGMWENEEAHRAFISNFTRPAAAADPSGGFSDFFRQFNLLAQPPYTPEWEQKYQAMLHDIAALSKIAAVGKSCSLPSFPFAMEWASLFQVIIVPEQTLFVFDAGTVRHIRTDGRPHPSPGDLWPTRMGDSVGHWEGATLVIDTIERTPGPVGFGQGADLSARAHFKERVRMIDTNTLEDRMTIEDPQRFTRPWDVRLQYRRVRNLDRMIASDCENDRNPVVNGRLVIAPPETIATPHSTSGPPKRIQ